MADADNDFGKFLEELKSEKVQKGFKNNFTHRGVFTFLPVEGDVISFGVNELGGQYDWGRVSQTHGYAEAAAEEPKKATGLSFLRGKALGGSAVATQTVTPSVPQVPEKKEEKVPEPAEEQVEGRTKVFPPPKLQGKAKNRWLRTFNRGQLPPNHESSQCFVMVDDDIVSLAQRLVTNTKEVEELSREIHKLRKDTGSADVSQANEDLAKKAQETAAKSAEILTAKGKEPITKPVASGQPGIRESASNYLPVMSDKEKETAMNKMATLLDAKNEKRPTPMEIQKLEARWPVFSDSIGIKFNEMLFLPVDKLVKLFDGNKIAACAFIEMRRRYIEGSGIKLEDLVNGDKPKVVTNPDEGTVKKDDVKEPVKNKLAFLRGRAA